ncbi:hypothetical protein Kpol_1069p17 [Vanderwaltozyma polyspora DSM 70294]|uniref:DNA polymerase eta n=1 Tax=Vanderwaltozyma polyspora (strain ATCC 22028 / DSM 70294 / BCRC 21397 / CBS 2163 / NBRC 10782 / NRRL Y-8283 / UCD 57-17) TaxID=436907 RepID=A7TRC6_VANPO|nr:uncharacterized protein Kpol_1069p17 [Vanderwaltozyma polyspora DSM 70294]EDO15194.1 hypothetical protein Kpol_1069p17 [Vanderwaltozyma polyspora DSM 70294]
MSKFKWRDLIQLNSKDEAYKSELCCLCHIDLNAFFAQVEQVRCGYTKDDPVVCVQWSSIIAISYAARKHDITRMDSIKDALKKSNNKLIPIHTAVYKKGEDFWQYHDGCGSWMQEASKQLSPEQYKVSLNPYRREGRKIFKIFKDFCDLVEIASVDEGFLDISRLCLQQLLFEEDILEKCKEDSEGKSLQERFIAGDYDLDSYLPPVPDTLKTLKFEGFVYDAEFGSLIDDWDDVIFALGSQISQKIRNHVRDTLGYTTSCGIARTKTVCKLGSNFKKPDAQTIIRNKSITKFFDNGNIELTNFWTMGGKLGQNLIHILNLPTQGSIKALRERWDDPVEINKYMNERLLELNGNGEDFEMDDDKKEAVTQKLFDLVRGQHCLPVNPRPIIKSMMSNKNLRGNSCKNIIDCMQWLDIFGNELADRVNELEQEYHKICIPKTISISVKTNEWKTYSKSSPLHCRGSNISSLDIIRTASKLINEFNLKYSNVPEPNFYPLKQFNVVISNFEILDMKKSVIEMIGNVKGDYSKKDLPESIPHAEPRDTEVFIGNWKCQDCNIEFESESAFNEHNDYHVALRLSESLNGADVNSKNISEGERRLLLSNKNRQVGYITKRKHNKDTNSTQKTNIFKFFKK